MREAKPGDVILVFDGEVYENEEDALKRAREIHLMTSDMKIIVKVQKAIPWPARK